MGERVGKRAKRELKKINRASKMQMDLVRGDTSVRPLFHEPFLVCCREEGKSNSHQHLAQYSAIEDN